MTIYRCSAIGSSRGADSWQFGLHLSKAAGNVDGAMTAFTDGVTKMWNGDGALVVGLKGYFPTETTIETLVVTALDPVTGKNVEQLQAGISLIGISAEEVLPAEVSMCVSLRTALPTRAGRGRFYLPSPDVSTLGNGLYTDAFLTDAANAAHYGLAALITSTYIPVIYHSVSKTFTAINSVDVGNVPDSQRRRRTKLVEFRQSRPLS